MDRLITLILDYLSTSKLDETSIFVYSIFFILAIYLFSMIFKAFKERKSKILEYELNYINQVEEIKKEIFLYLSNKEDIMQIKSTLYRLQLLLHDEPAECLEIINPEDSKTYEEINLKNIVIMINIVTKPKIRYVKLNLANDSNSFIDLFIAKPIVQSNLDILTKSIILTHMILLITLSLILIFLNVEKYSIKMIFRDGGLLLLLMSMIIIAEKIVLKSSKSTFKEQYDKLKLN